MAPKFNQSTVLAYTPPPPPLRRTPVRRLGTDPAQIEREISDLARVVANPEIEIYEGPPRLSDQLQSLGDIQRKATFADFLSGCATQTNPFLDEAAANDLAQEMLRTSVAYFASEMLSGAEGKPFFIGEHHEDWDALIANYDRICVLAPRGHGKCQVTGEPILRADGTLVPIEQWRGGKLVAWDEVLQRFCITEAPLAENNGVREVVQIVTATGRRVSITFEHPLLTQQGWKPASAIERGEKIAVARSLPNMARANCPRPWLLGLLVGDRNLTDSYAVLSLADPQLLVATREELEIWACELEQMPDRAFSFKIVAQNKKYENWVQSWLQREGIWCPGPHEKRVPESIFRGDDSAIADFVAGYLDATGWVNFLDWVEIGFDSVNRELLQDVQHLLTRLGIISTLTSKRNEYKDAIFFSWRLKISDNEAVRLARLLKPRGVKKALLAHIADDPIEAEKDELILWDEVREIRYLGMRQTWALSVPEHHTYLSREIVNHNTYFFSYAYPLWRATMHPRSTGFIFSATLDQAERILGDIKDEIESNPKLRHLMPKAHRMRWSARYIRLANDSRLYARGFGTRIRGAHPNFIIVDDGLNDETMYSETTRQKQIDYFMSAITNMILPTGQIIVVGTPMHQSDLYGELKNNEEYHFAKYPAINRDTGKVLWPEVFNLKYLERRKREIGTIRFTRELLCEPIADDMSLFPRRLFQGDPVEQFNVTLSMPLEYWVNAGIKSIFIGVDFAMSSSVEADYTVIWTMGVDDYGNRQIIDIVHEKGLAYQAQLGLINEVARKYSPALIYLEANQMQRIFGDELIRTTDLPIKQFITTASNKHNLQNGVPSLRVLLENRKFRIPRGDKRSVELTNIWIDECQSFTWVEGKLISTGKHDDSVLASWICDQAVRRGSFGFTFGDEDEYKERDEKTTQALLAELTGVKAEQMSPSLLRQKTPPGANGGNGKGQPASVESPKAGTVNLVDEDPTVYW